MEQEVIIDIKIDEGKAVERLTAVNKEISDLKQQNKDLARQIKDSGDATGELTKKMVENEKAVNLLKGEQKSLVGQLQNTEKANASLGDSYNEISARLSQMQKEYKSLSAEQRNSEGGKALLKQIGQQKQALKDMDATMGDFQRNVGNYPQVMGGFGGALEKAGLSVKGFSKTLLTTPFGWVAAAIGAVVAVFTKLRDAIKKNDDASTQFQRVFSSFRPILQMLSDGFAKVASWLGKVAGKIADIVSSFSKEAKSMQNVVIATDKLEEVERRYARQKAKNEAEIAKLREQAMDKEEYSAEQRRKFLEEAQKLEEQNLKGATAIQKARIALREDEAKRAHDTSDATKNELTQMYAELDRLERDYQNAKRTFTKQLNAINKEEVADIKAKNAEIKKANEERLRVLRESEKEEERIRAERLEIQLTLASDLEEALIENMEEGSEKRVAEINLRYDKEIEALKKKYEDEGVLTEEAQEMLTNLLVEKEIARGNAITDVKRQQAETEMQIEEAKAQEIERTNETLQKERREQIANNITAMGSFFDAVGQMSDAFGKDEKKRAKAQKTIALGKAAINTGLALAQGVAQAQSVGFPANIAAIAVTVATILANMATAVSTIKNAKFATGGVVDGTSFAGDKVQVNVNSGEMILNRQQQKQLFDIANGGRQASGINYEALAEAMSAMPAPVLDYQEFTAFEKRTINYNELMKL